MTKLDLYTQLWIKRKKRKLKNLIISTLKIQKSLLSGKILEENYHSALIISTTTNKQKKNLNNAVLIQNQLDEYTNILTKKIHKPTKDLPHK